MFTQQSGAQSVRRDIAVIIRSAGERTRDLCHKLLCDQVLRENIVVISEQPFTRALQRSFELGIEMARRWTLCVDADMLLRKTGVQTLLNWAEAAHANVFQAQGNLFDKILGGPRWVSPRLYRTSLLTKALGCIPGDGASLRPETSVRDQMNSLGYSSLHYNSTIGLHDFEQYYRDIYRKSFVHAHKHAAHMEHLESLWERWAHRDPDYAVALWGLRKGRLSYGMVRLDVRCFPKDLSPLLQVQGWEEKKALEIPRDADWDVTQWIIDYGRSRALAEPLR